MTSINSEIANSACWKGDIIDIVRLALSGTLPDSKGMKNICESPEYDDITRIVTLNVMDKFGILPSYPEHVSGYVCVRQ